MTADNDVTSDRFDTPPNDADASATTLCEILDDGPGYATLTELLELLDLACGRTAFHYAGGNVVTASFEELRLLRGVHRGAQVRVGARVVSTGRTSVLLHVRAETEDISKRAFVPCAEAFATFVAVDNNGRPRPVPSLAQVPDVGVAARARLSAARNKFKSAAEAARLEELRKLSPTASGPSSASELVRASDTVVCIRKQYLPRHQNFSGMVFGGDLLETTARVAAYAATRLVRARARAAVVAVKFFGFLQPMKPMNLWTLRARVAAVRGAHVYVEVCADRDDSARSHDALFAVLLTDTRGEPVDCAVRVDFDGTDDECLRAHARALTWINQEALDNNVLQ